MSEPLAPGERVTIGGTNPRFRGTVGEVVELVCYYVVKSPVAPNGTIRCEPHELTPATAIGEEPTWPSTEPAPAPPPAKPHLSAAEEKQRLRLIAQQKGYTGDCCGTCNSDRMVMDGRCSKCLDCGSTSGGCS